MTLRRRVQLLFAAASTVAVAVVIVGAVSLLALLDSRAQLVDSLDPARDALLDYFTALVNQQSGLRGFVVSGDQQFLEAHQMGLADESVARAALLGRLGQFPQIRQDVAALTDLADRWQRDFSVPELAMVGRGETIPDELLVASKAAFDDIRDATAALKADLDGARSRERDALDGATQRLVFLLLAAAVGLSSIGALIWWALRRSVTEPLERIAEDARRVARGELHHAVVPTGGPEFQALAADIDAMRTRILDELSTFEVQAIELTRSNEDLQQFAYVASHDLQEPLRKVASFCQLLQKHYQGQLDERADQYIEYAVDGAKRMQLLINDLLAFSRVSRGSGEPIDVDCNEALGRALRNLDTVTQESDAVIDAMPLPTVRGDLSLLTALFQNLVGNAIKYRGEGAPHVRIDARQEDEAWLFTVTDNGIGIPAEYSERVFVIFQRLHPKEDYEGTGIGLALCKKIVEFHGGTIWVEPDETSGTTIRWTLPASSTVIRRTRPARVGEAIR